MRNDDIIKAIRHRIGLPVDNDPGVVEDWSKIRTDGDFRLYMSAVAEAFGQRMEQAIKSKLNVPDKDAPADEEDLLAHLIEAVIKWITPQNQFQASQIMTRIIQQGLNKAQHAIEIQRKSAKPTAAPAPRAAPTQPAPARATPAKPSPVELKTLPLPDFGTPTKYQTQIGPPAFTTIPVHPAPKPPVAPAPVAAPKLVTEAPDPMKLNPQQNPSPANRAMKEQYAKPAQAPADPPAAPAAPASASSAWKWFPVPNDPDKHEESAATTGKSPAGLPIIAARVRGKKHKHEGTNCDDWYEFATTGPWTILVVGDGAGSKKFSRVGSRAACTAAAGYLAEHLREHVITPRNIWTAETFATDPATGQYLQPDLSYVQAALQDAMREACAAIAAAVAARTASPDHATVLGGRPIEINDLYTTLLIAVHIPITMNGEGRDLVLSCAIGDGMVAAIIGDGSDRLLMTPDSGEFSGEVEFLAEKIVSQPTFFSRVHPFIGSMRALMVMSDGVADDYFPNQPGMARLYADLVLNGIVPQPATSETIEAAIAALGGDIATANIDLATPVERIVANEQPVFVPLRSVQALAERTGVPVDSVAQRPALLTMGRRGKPMCDPNLPAERRLEIWLDTYHVRGSFDDRTLVVMHKEPGA